MTSTSAIVQPPQIATASGSKKTNIGAIVGPVVAFIAILFATGLASAWWRRRRSYELRSRLETEPDPFLPSPLSRNEYSEEKAKVQGAGVVVPVATVFPSVVCYHSQRDFATTAPHQSGNIPSVPVSVVSSGNQPRRTTTSEHSRQPSITTFSPTSVNPPSTSVPTLDVNHIIELIAQRIDPRSNGPVGDAPPQYRSSSTQ